MEKRSGVDANERLSAALERLTSIQTSILELNQEANQIRRYIKDFDVNVDALNILANVRSKDKKHDGAQVLDAVSQYAHLVGIHIKFRDAAPSSDSSDTSIHPDYLTFTDRGKENAASFLHHILLQCIAAVVITACLFLLVH